MKKIIAFLVILFITTSIDSESSPFDYFEIKSEPSKYIGKEFEVELLVGGSFSFYGDPAHPFRYRLNQISINNHESYESGDILMIDGKPLGRKIYDITIECKKIERFRNILLEAVIIFGEPIEAKGLTGNTYYKDVFIIKEIRKHNCLTY